MKSMVFLLLLLNQNNNNSIENTQTTLLFIENCKKYNFNQISLTYNCSTCKEGYYLLNNQCYSFIIIIIITSI